MIFRRYLSCLKIRRKSVQYDCLWAMMLHVGTHDLNTFLMIKTSSQWLCWVLATFEMVQKNFNNLIFENFNAHLCNFYPFLFQLLPCLHYNFSSMTLEKTDSPSLGIHCQMFFFWVCGLMQLSTLMACQLVWSVHSLCVGSIIIEISWVQNPCHVLEILFYSKHPGPLSLL